MTQGNTNENRQILEEAAAWFVDFRLGEVDGDKATRSRFVQWLQRSPEHVRAYVEIAGAYVGLPKPDAVDHGDIERLIERLWVRERSASTNTVRPLLPIGATNLPRPQIPRWWHLLVASLACLAVLMVVLLFVLSRDVYATGLAEQRSITLEDGSVLELNARTRLKVRLTDHERRVDLLEGQALFRVSKDALRPFIVCSGDAQVRALGTQFDVHLRQSGTTVTVIEGRVAVRVDEATNAAGHVPVDVGPAGLQLSAGDQLVITGAAVYQPPAPRISAATAWTQGDIEFDETLLVDAIEDFNRYSRTRLVLDGPAPDDMRISGVYSSHDTGSFIRFLRSQSDLVVTETDSEVRIRRK